MAGTSSHEERGGRRAERREGREARRGGEIQVEMERVIESLGGDVKKQKKMHVKSKRRRKGGQDGVGATREHHCRKEVKKQFSHCPWSCSRQFHHPVNKTEKNKCTQCSRCGEVPPRFRAVLCLVISFQNSLCSVTMFIRLFFFLFLTSVSGRHLQSSIKVFSCL